MASRMFLHLDAKVPTSSAVCRAVPDASVLCALDVWHMRVRSLQINRLTGAWMEFHPARREALRRLSACASSQGLNTGDPVDLRTGFDLNTREGQRKAWKIITTQDPQVVYMAPKCTAWMPSTQSRAAGRHARSMPASG